MGMDKYKDGAWMEPEETVERYDKDSGYWVDCEMAERVKEGAWEEVWANIKWLSLLSSNVTGGKCIVEDENMTLHFIKDMAYISGEYEGSVAGGGIMELYVGGKWTNPYISFDYSGGFFFVESGVYHSASAGEISIYSRDTDGTVMKTEVVPNVGETATGNDAGTVEGRYEGTLEGTFNRLGLSIYVSGYNGYYTYAYVLLVISNLKINGSKIAFPDSVQFGQ